MGLPGQANVGGNGEFAATPPQTRPGFPVELTATSASGTVLATGTVTREWMVPGEMARVLTLKNDKVAGVLFTPPPGTPRHPGVLPFGGAEGGMSQVYAAALLAAHGYPALTVAYFDWPGLPGHLVRIPLEYFETAGRIVAAQSGTDPAQNDPSQPAWALNGKGIAPGPIPEYDISGPVLALAAGMTRR